MNQMQDHSLFVRLDFWKSVRLCARAATGLLLLACLLSVPDVEAAPQERSGGLFQKLVDQNQPKMAKVFGAGAGRVDAFATGLIVSEQGHVLTSQGVFLDGREVNVVLNDGSEYQATVIRRNRVYQIALLKIAAETPEYFELSKDPVGEKGDWVLALTNAFRVADKDEPVSATAGIISLRTELEARLTTRDVAYDGQLVLIDAITSNPGAAGGAVITADSGLVGMVGKVISSSETNTRLNYAVPSSVLLSFLNDEQSEEMVKDPVETATGNADLGIVLFKLGGRSDPAYVDRVRRGTPAAKAKLRPDDMIVSIAGEKIGTVKEYESAVKSLRAGEEIFIIIKRGTEILRLPITPQERK